MEGLRATRPRIARPRAGCARRNTGGSASEHVREYNQSYNFFAGMSDDAVTRYQKDAHHRPPADLEDGHRQAPPAAMGMSARRRRSVRHVPGIRRHPLAAGARARRQPERRMVRNAERKALDELGLEIGASKHEIKARFKALVKRHHPDANGGDRAIGRPATRDHPGLQLSEIRRLWLPAVAHPIPSLSRKAAAFLAE